VARSRLFWLAVLVPVAITAGIELLADWALDPVLPFPLDTLVVTATVFLLCLLLVTFGVRRIDRLSGALDSRNQELLRREATARALHQVSVTIAATRDMESILRTVAHGASQVLGAEVALAILQDRDGAARLAASSGPAEALDRSPSATAAEPADFLAEPYRRAVLAAPMRAGGETMGTLAVADRRPRAFEVDDVETLSSLASQLALAIENARLEGRLREIAVHAERERIAREMHDGLAQVLGYVNTKSQAVEELLAADRAPEARRQLAQLAAAARSIYVDVREAILGLTSPVTPDRGLVGALEEYAGRFAEASKLHATVRAAPNAAGIELPAEVEAQAFRIVQEALTNVRKHAEAQRVTVDVELAGDLLTISVTDDGRGIPPTDHSPSGAPALWPHYGLTAMRERAGAIGAKIVVESAVGQGTTVRVLVPMTRPMVAGPA
jgi:signal transduction histidine kinase